MTTYASKLDKISAWAVASARMIEQTQTLAELPEDVRTYPLVRSPEATELTGFSEWVWREYVRSLPQDGRLESSPGGHIRATLAEVHSFMDVRGIRPRRPDHVPRATRIAIENFKGGSGKSSTCLHLGIALARRGYRILLIDTDPQATLTQLLGVRPAKVAPESTIITALTQPTDDPRGPLRPQQTYISGLSLLPSSLHLSALEVEVLRRLTSGASDAISIEKAFDRALAGIDGDFDLVLVDFQPAFSMTQALLLLTMDSLIVPMPTEAADFAGTSDFLYQIATVLEPLEQLRGKKKIWDPVLIVHTRLRKGTDLIHEIAATTFGANRLIEHVTDQPAISAAMSTMRSVFEVGGDVYDRRAIKRAQEQYDALALKIMEIIKKRWDEMKQEPFDEH